MVGPAIVVVAGGYTAWLAVTNPEALVVDDYYKQGTAINQALQRDHAAAELKLEGDLELAADGKIRLSLHAKPDYAWPPIVELLLAHPTRSEDDLHVEMLAATLTNGEALYIAPAPALKPVAYQLVLQDGDRWRLVAEWPKNATGVHGLKPNLAAKGDQ